MGRRDRTYFLRPGILEAPETPGKVQRAKAALTSKLRRAAECRDTLADTTDTSLAVLRTRLNDAISKGRTRTGDAASALSAWFNSALANHDFGRSLDVWLRESFASGTATAYDKAMDAVYNATHVGGGYHRIFDGGHSCVGAWEACSRAAEAQGDNFTAQVGGYLGAMWKDFVTPMGLPVATWHEATFDGTAEALGQIGISKSWLADVVCLNGSDLMGAVTGVLSVFLSWNRADIDKFAELAGNFGISSAIGANPLLGLIALVCLARAYHKATDGHGRRRILIGGAKGGIGSAVFLGAMALLSAKVWVGLMVGVIASILAHKAFEASQRRIEAIDWTEISAFILASLRRGLQATTASTGAFPPA